LASEAPVTIAARALTEATLQAYDVLLLDTAGRLHIDNDMMDEVRALETAIQPHERLFVVDSMAGQDAVNAAKAFNEALSLTGVILTKADGDARGGAALSVRHVTGKPILFVGMGEKSDALELFQPERIASRILGMGDVLSLVEQVREQVDQEKAEKLAKKISKGKSFDLSDLRDQLSQLQNMGGVAGLLDKLPAQMQANAAAAAGAMNAKHLKRQMGIIDSMTPRERRRPEMIDNSRKRRIAAGAGVPLPEVNRLLKQFDQMQKTMKKFVKGGMLKNMMRGMAGRLPPGGFGPSG
jgi:signal recognition particle subunit SRP54